MENQIQKLEGLISRMESKTPMTTYDVSIAKDTIKILERQILNKKYPNNPNYMEADEEKEYWKNKANEYEGTT